MSELLKDNDDIVIDQNKNYLEDLVGPGKKYANEQELAKAYFHADKTLEIQKRRMDQIRDDYSRERQQNLTRAQLEDVMDRFTKAQLTPAIEPQEPAVQTPTISPEQIESLVSNKIQENEIRKQQETNFNLVKNKLIEKYGANYKEAISKTITDLGMSGDEVDQMARTKPQVLINALGLNQTPQIQSFQAPIRSSQTPFPVTAGKPDRTWAWYQDLKRKDPKTYRDPKTQNQMAEDYIRLGSAFEDGDFDQFN